LFKFQGSITDTMEFCLEFLFWLVRVYFNSSFFSGQLVTWLPIDPWEKFTRIFLIFCFLSGVFFYYYAISQYSFLDRGWYLQSIEAQRDRRFHQRSRAWAKFWQFSPSSHPGLACYRRFTFGVARLRSKTEGIELSSQAARALNRLRISSLWGPVSLLRNPSPGLHKFLFLAPTNPVFVCSTEKALAEARLRRPIPNSRPVRFINWTIILSVLFHCLVWYFM